MTQYVARPFREGAYTYHYDGDEPLSIGDKVKVPALDDPEAWSCAFVEAFVDEALGFPTKPILGIAETAADRAARKAEGAL